MAQGGAPAKGMPVDAELMKKWTDLVAENYPDEITEQMKNDLLNWCKQNMGGRVKIKNFEDPSWKNGMAFCALVDNFLPDGDRSIDFNSLCANDAGENLKKAFETARIKFKVDTLIDVESFIAKSSPRPDWRVVYTAVTQLKEKLTK